MFTVILPFGHTASLSFGQQTVNAIVLNLAAKQVDKQRGCSVATAGVECGPKQSTAAASVGAGVYMEDGSKGPHDVRVLGTPL